MKSKNRYLTLFTIFGAAALAVACSQPHSDEASAAADTVFQHGYVYTVDAERSVAESVAVKDGRIVYVGTNAGAAEYIGDITTVVDLKGRMMLPGFQDSHVHPIGAGVEASSCNLNGLAGIPEYRSRILEYATANPDIPWILGGGWAMSAFGPGGSPNRNIIDEIVSDRPVFLTSQDGHTGWANSEALRVAGIDKNTPDPVDGRIDRDPVTGEPNGALQEGATSLITKHIPPTSPEALAAGLRYSVKLLNSFGITGIQDAYVSEEDLKTYKALREAGDLNLHVVASLWWDRERGLEQVPELKTLRDKYSDEFIDTATVKIMQDGVMENYTAAMLEPYLIPSGSRGIPMLEPELLKAVVAKLDAEGFQVHFHAIGDAAVRQSLDAIEEALIENGQLGHRHHISHLQMIDPADIPRFKELGAIANFQPLWAFADLYITELTIPFIGEERARWMYPIKSVLDTGAIVTFGSDWSVSPADVLPQIETAMTRRSATGLENETFIPDERIDLDSAIAAFTINAAFTSRREKDTGSIETGKLADLVVLERNLFETEPRDFSDIKILMTLFEGRVVHGTLE